MKGFYLKALALLLGLTAAGVLIATIMIAVIYPKLPGMDELRNYQPKLPLQVTFF
ncbi:MAG: hypothetical protein K0R94_919 [Burkholderiales bacterium]|nr:hypothetical protein [Burkholderiales bacterium]